MGKGGFDCFLVLVDGREVSRSRYLFAGLSNRILYV